MSAAHASDAELTLDDAIANDDYLDVVELPEPPQHRPRVLLVGSGMAIAGIVMAFAALIGVYVAARQSTVGAGHEWLPSGAIPLTGPNVALFTLLLSVVTMQWAVYSCKNHDRANTWVAVGLTVLLGAAFVNATTFIYSEMGLGVSSSLPAMMIYTITGAHLVLVAAALVALLIATLRTFGSPRAEAGREAISAAALLWYVTVGIFCVIWYAIYIVK